MDKFVSTQYQFALWKQLFARIQVEELSLGHFRPLSVFEIQMLLKITLQPYVEYILHYAVFSTSSWTAFSVNLQTN